MAEEGFFLGLDLWPNVYILVWAPWSVTPTIAPRDSSFLPYGRKGGSRCDDSSFTPIFTRCLVVRYSFSLSKSRS